MEMRADTTTYFQVKNTLTARKKPTKIRRHKRVLSKRRRQPPHKQRSVAKG